jgi:Ca2+-binding RTX toxin-like protein
MSFDAVIQLSALDGTNGFKLSGVAVRDYSGFSVASAGDVNGDGIGDLIIGAIYADPNGSYSGASYVVFGSDAGFAANLNLSTLNGTNGFRISGGASNDRSGASVASAGDVNGDGIDDLIIGASGAGSYAGASYVVFGSDAGFAANLNLSTLNGTTGFRISGVTGFDRSGHSVAGAGDVNGDGFDDLIIGAYGADPNGGSSGASYVVFGSNAAFAANLNLSALNGTNGFRIIGAAAEDQSGRSVASAGDVNGDGIDDLIIGAYNADANGSNSGASYVVFGNDAGFAANLNLSAIDGTNGFRISGEASQEFSGVSVASAGDVNGDGIGDLIIGAAYAVPNGVRSGASYVVFGSNAGFAANFNLSALNGTNGFRISGVAADDRSGISVAGAGDVNGDGFDDLIIGARLADPNGSASGSSYVVFGSGAAFAANINLSTLNGTNGFRMDGVAASDNSGRSVASTGDVNGDGVDDLIIGARYADPNGTNSGASYVVFGRVAPVAVVETGTGGDDSYVGGAADDDLSGGAGNDILNGGLGADLMAGGIGDDTYYVDDLGDVTDETGGDGIDTVISTVTRTLGTGLDRLTLTGATNIDGTGNALANILTGNDGGNTLDGGDGADQLLGGLGADDLVGGAGGDMLDGGTGADQMAGGTGDDTYVVDNLSDLVTEVGGEGSDRIRASVSLTLSADVENLELTGSGNIDGTGNGLANHMTGNSGDNLLSGGGGGDIIRGASGLDDLNGDDGNDQLLGGDGNDELYGGAANDILQGNADDDTLYGGAGLDNLDGGTGSDVLNGEAGNDKLLGGDGDDQLFGGDNNDQLTGGAGADTLTGGLGDDTYFVDDLSDTLVEALGEGNDVVKASVTWILGDNIERLVLDGSGDIDGTGNALANQITGNAGANSLDGAGGNDLINGGLGADTLIGGLGADTLIGGGGSDTFLIRQESVFTSSNPGGRTIETDSISDYVIGQDEIDLSDIDAIAATGAVNDAFSIVGAFNGNAGQMTLSFGGGITTVLLDIDGDQAADYRLRINGDVRADTADWVL